MTRRFKTLIPKGAKPRGAPPQPEASPAAPTSPATPAEAGHTAPRPAQPVEHGGPDGPEPTRYGDWERKGICYDF